VSFRRFVFAIDSVSLFGSDIYTSQSQTVGRQQLIEMVTPDLVQIIESYRGAVERVDEGNEHLLCFYSRLIGKRHSQVSAPCLTLARRRVRAKHSSYLPATSAVRSRTARTTSRVVRTTLRSSKQQQAKTYHCACTTFRKQQNQIIAPDAHSPFFLNLKHK
jgi:hypothetical protein